jgi:hypothetical protein
MVLDLDLDLVTALRPVLEAYRERCCPARWHLIPFEARRVGPGLQLDLRDETFERTVSGSPAGFMLLAGRYWGATLDERTFALCPTWLRNLDAAGQVEASCRPQLVQLAVAWDEAGESEEAAFLLRRALLGSRHPGYAGLASGPSLELPIPARLRAEALRAPRLTGLLEAQASWTVDRALSAVAPFLEDGDPLERAVAVVAAEDILRSASGASARRVAAAGLEQLLRCCGDPNAFVQERALAALERLAELLWLAKAWDELTPCLEPLVEHGVLLAEQLRRRWLCRTLEGDDARAQADWTRMALLGTEGVALSLDGTLVNSGSIEDYRLLGLTRVAGRQLERGDEPEGARLARAGELLARAEAGVEERVARALQRGRQGEGAEPRSLPLVAYFEVRGRLAERRGDLDAALEAYRRGREYDATAHGPRTGTLREDLDRVRLQRLAPLVDVVPDFDPRWLTDDRRGEGELDAAMARWSAVRWAEGPRDRAEARATPLAAALVRRFDVARTWPRGQGLERQAALFERLLPVALARPGRTLAAWEEAFEPQGAVRVAFGVEAGPSEDASRAYEQWLAHLERAPATEAAVLELLPAEALGRVAVRLARAGAGLDLERSLADQVFAATGSGRLAARAVRSLGRLAQAKGALPGASLEAELAWEPRLGAAWWRFAQALSQAGSGWWRPSWFEPRLFWPLAGAWDPALEPSVAAALRGELDASAPTEAQRRARARTARWLAERTGCPALAGRGLAEVAAPRPRARARAAAQRAEAPPVDGFVDGVLESVREDLVPALSAGSRAEELCQQLVLDLSGQAGGGALSRFDGPRYLVHRQGDLARGLALYAQLEAAWTRRVASRGRDPVLAGLVRELAGRWREAPRWTWEEVRELFADDEAGRRARAVFEAARSEGPGGQEPRGSEPRRYGLEVVLASDARATRLVDLHARCIRFGGAPGLAEALEHRLLDEVVASRLLEPLRRAEGFEVVVLSGSRATARRRSVRYGQG